MPCLLLECSPQDELKRFAIALGGLYLYHFLWDKIIITPLVDLMVRKKWVPPIKREQMRESMWKNAAVGTFFMIGISVCIKYDWFMNPQGYFVDWPFNAPEDLRWYYRIYFSFWIQSVDFFLNISGHHYKVKRKDNAEMLVHHIATMSLMLGSYLLDLTRVGACVLLIHDVNDLLLETAKMFVYMGKKTIANVMFGIFAVVWFLLRWGFFSYNIIYRGVFQEAYKSIIMPIYEHGGYFGFAPKVWYGLWIGFICLLVVLLSLHVAWGYMIIKMVVRTAASGNIDKDIRSDSEAEDEYVVKEEPSPAVRRRAAKKL